MSEMMKICYVVPGVDPEELAEYLLDAVRGPSLGLAVPVRMQVPAWRGTASRDDPPRVKSWATEHKVAWSFGSTLHFRTEHLVLAIVLHFEQDGSSWYEYVTKEPLTPS